MAEFKPEISDDGAPQVYPEKTELFQNGISPERVERVARVLPQLLQRYARPMPEATVVAHHWLKDRGSFLQHEGWRIERMAFERPVRREDDILMDETRAYALFVPLEGGLQVCSSAGERTAATDIVLTSYKMEQYEQVCARRSPFGRSVPEEVRLFNAVAVGGLVTDFVMTHGILGHAREFALSDPPKTAG